MRAEFRLGTFWKAETWKAERRWDENTKMELN
jgi:hypothetical protein